MHAETEKIQRAKKIIDFIKAHDNFLISAHINADGDAIASVIAINLLLAKMNKSSVMVLHDQKIDERYNYLKGFENILSYSDKIPLHEYLSSGKIESAVLLDVPAFGRLGDVQKILPEMEKIVKIDHHPFEDLMGNVEWVDEHISSTAAMVYEIVEQAGVGIDKDLAAAIFTGILYDTGRFSFFNTKSRDFYIASKMVQAGVEPAFITNRLFFESSFSALKTIGKGLFSLENHLDGAVNIIYLDLESMRNQDQSEIEELANYSVAIRSGKVGLFIREIKPGFHKISLRSKSGVDVNRVAKAFDGGGHTRAAGCRVQGAKDEIIARILDEIKKQL